MYRDLIAELRGFAEGSTSARASLMRDAAEALAALSSPPADDVREALDSDLKALMGRLWAAADNAGVSRAAVEFEWPECHKPKCRGSHGTPDVAMSYMKRAIMAEIEAELRYRSTTRPDHAPDSDSPERAAALNLAILLSNHNVHDEGTLARAADRLIEAYPELVPVFSGEVRLRGTVTADAHDRDEMFICRKCGHGLTAAEVINGEAACRGAVTDADTSELEDLAYLITAHRFRERGLRGAIGDPDVEVARPLAVFLLNEGYRREARP